MLGDRVDVQNPAEIPKIYHPRLTPTGPRGRSESRDAASELAVERALDWLSRHQDEEAVGMPGSRGTTTGRPSKVTTTSPCTVPPVRNVLANVPTGKPTRP